MAREPGETALIEEMHRLGDELGRAPKQLEMEKFGEYSHTRYYTEFGSWNDALSAAGYSRRDTGGKRISNTELEEDLNRVYRELGRVPTRTEYTDNGKYSIATYHRRYGSWNKALNDIGISTMRKGQSNISSDDLKEEILKIKEELGRVPSRSEVVEMGEYSSDPYRNAFGSWSGALRAAGIEYTKDGWRQIPDEKLLRAIHRLKEDMGEVPSLRDMKEKGDYSYMVYYDRFGGWKNALEEAGLEWPGMLSGVDHPRWNGGKYPYGPGFGEKKKEMVRERDGRTCQHCGRSEEEHLELFGQRHPVHHIQKARTFDDPEKRNDENNLITLCKGSCHKLWDSMSPLRPEIPTKEVADDA